MSSDMYLYLMLFGLANVVFFGIVTFFVLGTRRQQHRLNELSTHIEELLNDMREADHLIDARVKEDDAQDDEREEEAKQP